MRSRTKAANHHVLPLAVYLAVGGLLFVLTGVTVLVAHFDFGAWNLVVAMGIAAAKGTCVALYFMHLKYDHRLFGLIFVLALLFVAVFIVFTMFDTMRRGDLYGDAARSISPYAAIYDADGEPLPMSARVFAAASGQRADEAAQEEEVPFELIHGYGPIKEVVEVGPLDESLAMKGQPIFESKCATCHRLDERYTGPPLRGVTAYRSATFIMNQILDPTQNVANHPDMQGMLKTYMTYMTNQNVTREDARALVEYLRWELEQGPQP